jgi:hypothetical protein
MSIKFCCAWCILWLYKFASIFLFKFNFFKVMLRGFPSNIILKDAVITNVSLKPFHFLWLYSYVICTLHKRVYCYMVLIPVLYVFMHTFFRGLVNVYNHQYLCVFIRYTHWSQHKHVWYHPSNCARKFDTEHSAVSS